MVLSWYSWNWPLTKRRTRLDFPTADSPRRTSLNWQILFPVAGPLGRPAMMTHWRCGSESRRSDRNETRMSDQSGTRPVYIRIIFSEVLEASQETNFLKQQGNLTTFTFYCLLLTNTTHLTVYTVKRYRCNRSRYIDQAIYQHCPFLMYCS